MKSLELELEKRILVVEDVVTGSLDNYYNEYIEKNPGKYLKFICKGSEFTNEIAKILVHQSLHTGLFAHYVADIPVNTFCYKSALDSFISAIEAKGWYWKNPLGDYSQALKRHIVSGSWQEAEEKTFHPEKCLIFKIIEG